MMRSILKTISALALTVASSTAWAAVVVIVSASSGAGSASSDEVSRVFLGKSSSLGGASVTPVDQSSGSASREAFYKAVVGKSGGELKSYWARQTFTGKGQPPKEKGDDRAVKAYVASNPGTVGYVDSSVVDASVKVILKV